MSSTDPTTAKRLTGWGRTAPTVAQVLSTPDPEAISSRRRDRRQAGRAAAA